MVDGGPIAYGPEMPTVEEAITALETYHTQKPKRAAEKSLVNENQTANQNKQTMSDNIKATSIGKIIADDTDISDGDIIKKITGTITGIFDPKKGGDGDKQWEFQNATLKDATGSIKITFSKCSQPLSAKGKTVTIISKKSDAHGWNGIKVEDKTYTKNQGKSNEEEVSERILKITPTAEITYEGGTPSATQSSGGSAGPSNTNGPARDLSIHPQNIILNTLMLHQHCHKMTAEAYPIEKGKLSEESQRAYVSSVFIEAVKQGAAIDFATRNAKPAPPLMGYPPVPTDPSKWKEAVIPKGANAGKTLEEIDDDTLRAFHEFYEGKKDTGNMAKCVGQAMKDRNLLPPDESGETADSGGDPW